jgi:DNA (cytosine-5)-methyltransferase 1
MTMSDTDIHVGSADKLVIQTPTVTVVAEGATNVRVHQTGHDVHKQRDLDWLKQTEWPKLTQAKGTLRGVDLFSGCGGITMGLWEACRENNLNLEMAMACDLFPAAKTSFVENFSPKFFLESPIENYVDGELGAEPTEQEEALKEKLGDVNVVVGGPPCQGNSNLNNHTRGDDPRNELYMRMIRFVELFKPRIVLVENVRGVVNNKQKVVPRANAFLKELGYAVDHGVVKGPHIGIPQTRARHFTVAIREQSANVEFEQFSQPTVGQSRSVGWVIDDLQNKNPPSDALFYHPPKATKVNQDRMNWFFEGAEGEERYNLPNHLRPKCQQGDHTYPAVYGRMNWDDPAPTLTTGFGCNGRGRFTHPREARVLSPHEAARVQTFPDFFDFTMINKRTDMHDLIGNAVPPLMAKHILSKLIAISEAAKPSQ